MTRVQSAPRANTRTAPVWISAGHYGKARSLVGGSQHARHVGGELFLHQHTGRRRKSPGAEIQERKGGTGERPDKIDAV